MTPRSFLVGITGAQGVGKSTFCAALQNTLRDQLNQEIALLDGLGEQIKKMGLVIGAKANPPTVAAFIAAHISRELEAPPGIVLMDRCMIDGLAYIRVLNVNTPLEMAMYDAVARLSIRHLALVVHLQVSPTFSAGYAPHETLDMREHTAKEVLSIIEDTKVTHISVDAQQQRPLAERRPLLQL